MASKWDELREKISDLDIDWNKLAQNDTQCADDFFDEVKRLDPVLAEEFNSYIDSVVENIDFIFENIN